MTPLDTVAALYLHIPFCERKCEYCDFMSVAGTRGQHEYVAALRDELRWLAPALRGSILTSIFCGGGTPGLLDLDLMAGLMEEVRACFTVAADAEITLEVNPSSTSAARAAAWRAAGFNRVSVGVQSTHPEVLRFLGRVHDGPRALAALRELREGGFDNVSADLIYAVAGLSDDRWRETLDQVLAAEPDHVSCYELTIEEGTPLHRSVSAGRACAVDAELALRQHWIAVAVLAQAGYAQYEVSNFARSGRQCRHNLVYWRNQPYAAAGVGAHGHLPAAVAKRLGLGPPPGAISVRHHHGRRIAAYREAVAARSGWPHMEWVTESMRAEETVMLGLRLAEGVHVAGGPQEREARALAGAGFLRLDEGWARVTPRGEDVLNQVALRLVLAGAVP